MLLTLYRLLAGAHDATTSKRRAARAIQLSPKQGGRLRRSRQTRRASHGILLRRMAPDHTVHVDSGA